MSKFTRRSLLSLLGLGAAAPALAQALPAPATLPASVGIGGRSAVKILWSGDNMTDPSSWVFHADAFEFIDPKKVVYAVIGHDGRPVFEVLEDGTIRMLNIIAEDIGEAQSVHWPALEAAQNRQRMLNSRKL